MVLSSAIPSFADDPPIYVDLPFLLTASPTLRACWSLHVVMMWSSSPSTSSMWVSLVIRVEVVIAVLVLQSWSCWCCHAFLTPHFTLVLGLHNPSLVVGCRCLGQWSLLHSWFFLYHLLHSWLFRLCVHLGCAIFFVVTVLIVIFDIVI